MSKLFVAIVTIAAEIMGAATLAVVNNLFTSHKVMEDGAFAISMAGLFLLVTVCVALVFVATQVVSSSNRVK